MKNATIEIAITIHIIVSIANDMKLVPARYRYLKFNDIIINTNMTNTFKRT